MPEKNQRNIGATSCPFCLSTLTIHTNKNGRYYGHCPECGPFNIHGNSFQDWVEDRLGTTIEAEPAPQPEPEPVESMRLADTRIPEPETEPDLDSTPEPETQDDTAGRDAFFDMYG